MAKKTTKKGVAKKQANKAPAKPKGKGKAKAADEVVTLEQFREAAKEYLRADENVKLHEKRRKAQQPLVKGYVESHAGELDKGKSRGFVDSSVKWLLVPGAMKVDDDAGVAALQSAIAKAKGDKKRVLEACLKPTIDRAAFDNAKAVGMVDDDLIEAYEKGRSYALKWSHTDDVSCPQCRAVATRNAKFCGQCGADLTSLPEYLK